MVHIWSLFIIHRCCELLLLPFFDMQRWFYDVGENLNFEVIGNVKSVIFFNNQIFIFFTFWPNPVEWPKIEFLWNLSPCAVDIDNFFPWILVSNFLVIPWQMVIMKTSLYLSRGLHSIHRSGTHVSWQVLKAHPYGDLLDQSRIPYGDHWLW